MLRNRFFQIEWFESAFLLQFDAPLSRQFERRDETRRDRRAAQRTVIVARQEIGEFGPVELHPQHPLKMMQRRVERDDRSEERPAGKEGVSKGRSRGAPEHYKKNKDTDFT